MFIKIVCTRYREERSCAEERRKEVVKNGEREKPSRRNSFRYPRRYCCLFLPGVDQGGVLVKKTNCSRKSEKEKKRLINYAA